MSWNINRVLLIGRLSKDVDLKYTPSNTPVASFGLAVGGKPKPDGSDSVSFFNVVVWGKAAENCSNYLSKGKLIGIDGRLEQRSWTAQDGTKRSTVEVIAERVEFLTPMQSGQPSAAPRQQAAPQGNPQQANDAFYDNTGFDPTPIDPGFYDQLPDLPNF
jgi:single-strand DNA-binding protein